MYIERSGSLWTKAASLPYFQPPQRSLHFRHLSESETCLLCGNPRIQLLCDDGQDHSMTLGCLTCNWLCPMRSVPLAIPIATSSVPIYSCSSDLVLQRFLFGDLVCHCCDMYQSIILVLSEVLYKFIIILTNFLYPVFNIPQFFYLLSHFPSTKTQHLGYSTVCVQISSSLRCLIGPY